MKPIRIIKYVGVVVIIGFLIIYARLKSNEAQELKIIAEQNLVEGMRQEQLAIDAAIRARVSEAEAIKARAELDICRRNK